LKRTAREIIAEIIVKVEMFSQALKRTAGEIIGVQMFSRVLGPVDFLAQYQWTFSSTSRLSCG
jgi:hypothetical protein